MIEVLHAHGWVRAGGCSTCGGTPKSTWVHPMIGGYTITIFPTRDKFTIRRNRHDIKTDHGSNLDAIIKEVFWTKA
jgi:hypothetical protein